LFEELLARIASGLSRGNLPYMIIGGQAVLIYGEPRLTKDIDITLGINIDRLNELLAVVKELSLTPLPEDVSVFVQKTMVLPVLEKGTGIRVDFIFSFTPYEKQAIGRAKRIILSGQEVCFASLEDLILHKMFAGRPRDLEDVRTLILKNPGFDVAYIRRWLREFDTSVQWKGFLEAFEKVLKNRE
jgi:predicted nucleotidyltransferase